MNTENLEMDQLNLYSLERFGIPGEVLRGLVFEHGGDPSLLELQRKGIMAGVCDKNKLLGRNGIISGPTCSGKTLLAELRMLVRYFDEQRRAESDVNPDKGRAKTIFLVPMRAIGLEKLSYFGGLYGRFGFKVLYSDGDNRINDGNILRGKFDIAIIVNEKLRFFQQHNREFFRHVGEVVVDEIGLISDKSRGPNLEITLTGLLSCSYKPTILALTTPLEGIERLAKLMDGFLLETETRPADIRVGIWSRFNSEFESWSCNTLKGYAPERIDLGYPMDRDRTLKELVLRYRSRIMFAVPCKKLVYGYARRLYELAGTDAEVNAAMVGQTHSSLVDQRMKGLEETRNKEILAKYLKLGIGLHHADLTPEERKEVEYAFRNGEIPTVFCTSTLARGVNLPTQTVVFLDWGDVFTTGDQSSPCYRQLPQDFTSWVGRVGRFDKSLEVVPTAIYVAQARSEIRWIQKLIHMKKGRLYAHLTDDSLDIGDLILSAAASLCSWASSSAESEPRRFPNGLFSLKDLKYFFTNTLRAGDESSEHKITNRLTNGLVRLVDPQGDQLFVHLRQTINQTLRRAKSRQEADLHIRGAQIPKFVLGLEELEDTHTNATDIVARVKSELIDSLEKRCWGKTLPELRQIFDEIRILEDIDWMIAVIGALDNHYLYKGLYDLSKLLETDVRLSSIPHLRPAINTLRNRISDLVQHEFQNMRQNKGLAKLRGITHCGLALEQAIELGALLDREDVLKLFFQRLSHSVGDNVKKPSYLRWVEEGEEMGFQLTSFGKFCCSHGISNRTCDELYSWIHTTAQGECRREFKVVDILDLLLKTLDGQKISLLRTNLAPAVVAELFQAHAGQKCTKLEQSTRKNTTVTLLAIADWLTGKPAIEIENYYGLYAGSLHEVSKQVSRLVRAFSDIAQEVLKTPACDSETEATLNTKSGIVKIPEDLEILAETILHGLPIEALPIAHLGVEGLSRGWVMKLLHGLQTGERSQGLPIVERLQHLGEDRLKEMLPTRGLITRLVEKLGDQGKKVLATNLVGKRDFLRAYYLLPQVIGAQLDRSKPRYGAHARNTALRVITSDGHHVVLRRNDRSTGSPIRIQDEQDLMEWVKRGAVDFYGEISEEVNEGIEDREANSQSQEPRFVTDRFFVDLDPQNGYPMDRLKAVAERIYVLFRQLPQVESAKICWSGGKGFYIIGIFKEEVFLDIQIAKQKLNHLLTSWGVCNDADIFFRKDPTNLDPHLIVDLASMMPRGLYRNEFSVHAVSGGCCLEVNIDELTAFYPAKDATPDAVRIRLLNELTKEEENDYVRAVSREMESLRDVRGGMLLS
ncbi:DEAD/DEAH box helicase [Chloroflexota bacterium]